MCWFVLGFSLLFGGFGLVFYFGFMFCCFYLCWFVLFVVLLVELLVCVVVLGLLVGLIMRWLLLDIGSWFVGIGLFDLCYSVGNSVGSFYYFCLVFILLLVLVWFDCLFGVALCGLLISLRFYLFWFVFTGIAWWCWCFVFRLVTFCLMLVCCCFVWVCLWLFGWCCHRCLGVWCLVVSVVLCFWYLVGVSYLRLGCVVVLCWAFGCLLIVCFGVGVCYCLIVLVAFSDCLICLVLLLYYILLDWFADWLYCLLYYSVESWFLWF